MQISLITFSNITNRQSAVLDAHKELLAALNSNFDVRLLMPDELDKIGRDDFVALFVTIGGIESLLVKQIEALDRPLILIADDYDNSLPTAIETSAWIRQHGFKCEVVYGEKDEVILELQLLYNCFKAQRSLIGTKIGVVGTPSPLLISSGIDYLLTKRRWGLEFVDIPIDEVISRFKKIRTSDVSDKVPILMDQANLCRECSPTDIVDSIKLYHALLQLCEDYGLKNLSINCKRILAQVPVTACLASALMNDDGYTVGCEGDLQALFTMIAIKAITSNSSFMVNTNHIDKKRNEVVLSHCTVGLDLTDKFDLRSHYASGKSVSIQGYLPAMDYSVVRCGGECLDQYFVSSGHLVENTNYTPFYRTQIRMKLNTPVSYFLTKPLGNHHVVVPGNQVAKIDKFFQGNSCKKIE
jgi:L-fucose isomerase-like protein